MVLLETAVEVFYAFGTIFLLCELGERLTIAYDELECEIEQYEWYLFPIEIQRLLPLVVINAQQLVAMQCFGRISSNRDAFKKVLTNFVKWKSRVEM